MTALVSEAEYIVTTRYNYFVLVYSAVTLNSLLTDLGIKISSGNAKPIIIVESVARARTPLDDDDDECDDE